MTLQRDSVAETTATDATGAPRTGPAIWCVSDGRAGIMNQTLALAAALAEPERASLLTHIQSEPDAYVDGPVILQPRGWRVLLPPDKWPDPELSLPREQAEALSPPWPDLWIAAGRRSIPFSRLMGEISEGKTMVVQTQDPRIDTEPFDLIIPPEHDQLQGPNVLPILGSPVWFSKQRVEDAQRRFSGLLKHDGQKVLVSLGGDSKTHRMTEMDAELIETAMRTHAKGRTYWISVSRRTPDHARERFRKLAKELRSVFWESEERDGPNPYVAFLSMCDVALVTEDSANMLSDPAFFGKPIHVLPLTGDSPRFDRLHKGFIKRGAARWFDGTLEPWAYPPIREAARAADGIVRLLLQKHPPPGSTPVADV
ncbi:MAG TPA: mitochondrial fission ELM1 family protein [Hyphomonadaceae bacterium]|nr:mitochondrial fission ELM1 family protein [Hyphomonadaceae bacterium]